MLNIFQINSILLKKVLKLIMWDDHQKLLLKVLADNKPKTDWENLLIIHNEKIAYLQHERLVHLLVMLTVGLATMVLMVVTILTQQMIFLIPTAMFFMLLTAYIIYYQKLETMVQKWYEYSDNIRKKIV
jgi:hypothetical protein